MTTRNELIEDIRKEHEADIATNGSKIADANLYKALACEQERVYVLEMKLQRIAEIAES